MNILTRVARSLISRFGTSASLSNPLSGSYDVGSGRIITSGSTPTTLCQCVVMDATLSKQNFEVQTGDLSITIRGDKFTPNLSTEILLNETRYKCIKVVPIFAGGDDIALFEIQGRLM